MAYDAVLCIVIKKQPRELQSIHDLACVTSGQPCGSVSCKTPQSLPHPLFQDCIYSEQKIFLKNIDLSNDSLDSDFADLQAISSKLLFLFGFIEGSM